MNDLSQMLYAADVASSLIVALAVGGLVFSGLALAFFLASCDTYDDDAKQRWGSKARKFCLAAVALITLWVVVPSKETMYAIAASEMGEQVLNSKIGGKAQEALSAWLDRQIDESAPDKGE